jgi:ketosteroid isomerase-like protein
MSETNTTEVLAVNQAFYQAFEKKDLKAMSLVWWQGNSLCVHPGGNVIKGWEEVRNSWEQIFRHTNYLEIEAELIKAEIGERLAYLLVLETVLQISRGKSLQAQSIATNIFEKMAQKWYLVHHHGSPIMR